MLLAQQAWDFVIFRWDRYVLTFGLYDQLRIFGSLRELWSDFWSLFKHHEKPGAPRHHGSALDALAPGAVKPLPRRLPDVPLALALALTLIAAAVFLLYLRLKPPLSATAAYRRLRRRLGRAGARLSDAVPPLAVQREAAARFPAAAEPTARVIAFYLRESFGGEGLEAGEREALKAALLAAEKNMRKAG
jgi:hypothetical protein